MKILCVFGTRPEAIKMAPVLTELKEHSESISTIVCVTAQHREMLDSVLNLFHIGVDYDLDIMEENQSLSALTANVLSRLDPIIAREQPDWVLVQGDTTTVMASALAAYYHRVRIGHIEAGLRTRDKYNPFPEEINRKLVDGICDLHFAPTETARANLLREGIDDASIVVTGNTVIDALLHIASREPHPNGFADAIPRDNRLILVTAHRRENFGAPLENICEALRDIAAKYQDVQIVYPVHLNPNVQQVVHRLLDHVSNITLLAPVDYQSLVHLMQRAYLVMTDSGGLQEEVPTFGVPVLVLRDTTERPEAVWAGAARLVGTDRARIVEETSKLLDDAAEYSALARAVNPFGDGHASERIVQALLSR
jgi:UDP-N-acetylglucosamine 2-epimerase (non-hydrolysing)